MKYKLTVVTVTYKPNEDELRLFLESYRRYNDLGDDAKMIIVDNSPLGSWDIDSMEAEFAEVDFISNPSNPGFGASNNLGYIQYESECVLFINNDVELLQTLFKDLISEFAKDEKIGCIGIHQDGGAPSFFPKMTVPKGTKIDIFDDHLHFISGAFMLFRSDIFEEIGMFDENIFMYFEEFDLSERLIAKGYKTVFLPEYKFLHKAGGRRTSSEFASMKGTQTQHYICRKYHLRYNLAMNWGYVFRQCNLIVYNILTLNFREVPKLVRIICYRIRYVWTHRNK